MGRKAEVYYYTSPKGGNPFKDFLDSLSQKQQAKILRIFQIIEEYGLNLTLPYIRKLSGTPLWEIRVLGKDNFRVIYVVPKKGIVLVLHGFVKKTRKTPRKEIKTALLRWKEWQNRS